MTIDVVNKLELLVELFERRVSPAPVHGDSPCVDEGSLGFVPPSSTSLTETITLAEMLAGGSALMDAYGRRPRNGKDDLPDVAGRIARFLAENAETIDKDAPQSPRVLHYVYPVV